MSSGHLFGRREDKLLISVPSGTASGANDKRSCWAAPLKTSQNSDSALADKGRSCTATPVRTSQTLTEHWLLLATDTHSNHKPIQAVSAYKQTVRSALHDSPYKFQLATDTHSHHKPIQAVSAYKQTVRSALHDSLYKFQLLREPSARSLARNSFCERLNEQPALC
jgi:hypothetical protein